jgi:hypothetical protein
MGAKPSANLEDLTAGQLYRVALHDCCVEAVFTSRFVRYERHGADAHVDDRGEVSAIVFECGEVTNWIGVVVTPAETSV